MTLPLRAMRLIGHLNNESSARTFGDYLTSVDIRNHIEAESDNSWAIWVQDEDQIATGQSALEQFQKNPAEARFRGARTKAAAVAEKERDENKAAQKRMFTRDSIWPGMGSARLTMVLIGISVLVTLVGNMTPIWPDAWRWLKISEYPQAAFLPEVRTGQVWRLITPIFFHFSILHLFFDMWWLSSLGAIIEHKQGTTFLALMVLVIAIPSNLGQYFLEGPGFGGMSGVVYGLFGYIWIRGRVDPSSGYFMPPTTVIVMVGWYLACLVGLLGDIANVVHTIGLGLGMAWGASAKLTSGR